MSELQPQIIKTSWLKIIAITLFFSVVGVAEYLIRDYQNYQKYQAERSAAELAIRIKSQLETELHGATFLTHGIEAYVVARNGNIVPEEINSMLQQVYQFSPYFRNIGIAPNNELRWVMPIEGNEAAIGLRYDQIPAQWPDIKKTIDSRHAKLFGPLELVQGDLGIIYRSPLYIDGIYWGLISAVIDADSLFQSLIKEVNEAGVPARLGLRHINNSDVSDEIFLGNASLFDSAEVTMNVDVPGGKWLLAITSDSVLQNLWPVRILVWCLSFLGILGLFYLTRQIYQRRLLNSLASEVQARTGELTAVSNKLNHVLNAASETAIIATDKNGLINVFNRGAERMLGYSAQEVINEKTPAIFHDPEEVKEKG
ncbi:MAG: CHASE domain-containing protein, partial [Idiomarina sp.]|nr:CHASE domain-containing protein [Idiomarina sp.]